VTTYEAVGCPCCLNTGYKGRIAAYEILPIDADWRELIHRYTGEDVLREKFAKDGLKTMQESVIRHYLEGNSDIVQVKNIRAEVGTL
jgi:type II secretory ATPase GspE/PulE/Tfp pilus assembly ATPase PilB-like protein